MRSSSKREAVKAGKHKRISKMIGKLQANQARRLFDEQLVGLLGVKKETR
jgi:hypothetical protein